VCSLVEMTRNRLVNVVERPPKGLETVPTNDQTVPSPALCGGSASEARFNEETRRSFDVSHGVFVKAQAADRDRRRFSQSSILLEQMRAEDQIHVVQR